MVPKRETKDRNYAAEGYEVLKSSADMSILREKQPQERQMWKETEDEEVF